MVLCVATDSLVILVECVAIDTLEIFGTKRLTNNVPHIVTHIAKVCHATRCNHMMHSLTNNNK